MKLTKLAKKAIRNNQRLKSKLALKLGCSEAMIDQYLRNDDALLTTTAALLIIHKETGLSTEEILEKKHTSLDKVKIDNPFQIKIIIETKKG